MTPSRVFYSVSLALLLVPVGAHAALRDTNFAEAAFVTTGDNTDLSGMAWAPDGSNRLFLIGKKGTVYVAENGVLRPEPFLDLPSLYLGSECGLIGIAFDPNFLVNRYVYLFMTISDTEQRIVRYRDEDGRGVDETPIVSGIPTRGANHDGGALGFGPDGKLYWAVGDLGNGTGMDADLTSLASKVGRANRDGSVPGDNPFDDGSGPNHDSIWARGFRNPFTMTFQPTTEKLWLNVVGTWYEQTFVVEAGDHGGWGAHEYDMPAGFIQPVIRYITSSMRPNDTYVLTAGGAARSGGTTTFTVVGTAPHRMLRGEQMTVSGVADASFNGTFHITAIPTPQTFSVEQAGPDAASGGGQAMTQNLGSCITGGTFYDSSAVSAEYRQNFFVGDFVSGLILRTPVEDTTPTAVSIWGEGHSGIVDITLGPDGNLYYVSYYGLSVVQQASFRAAGQGLVVTPLHIRMLEGGDALFNVRLASAPTEALEVAVARRSGDADLSLVSGQTLRFDASDWSRPKVVRLSAARDADVAEDTATFRVTLAGVPNEVVTVRATDEWSSTEPPGEAGSGGDSDGGMGGSPGGTTGGSPGGTTGGNGPGGESAAGAPAGGVGMGGQADAGEAGAPSSDSPSAKSDGGCGCATHRDGGASAGGLFMLGLFLLRRRQAARALARGVFSARQPEPLPNARGAASPRAPFGAARPRA